MALPGTTYEYKGGLLVSVAPVISTATPINSTTVTPETTVSTANTNPSTLPSITQNPSLIPAPYVPPTIIQTGFVYGPNLTISRNVNPYSPQSPYSPTPILKPISSVPVSTVMRNSITNIANRLITGIAGVIPPSPSEAKTPITMQDWNKLVNRGIPLVERSASPAEVAMTPRVDESSPTGLASIPSFAMSGSAGTDSSETGNSPDAGTQKAGFSGIALFLLIGAAIFIMGRVRG